MIIWGSKGKEKQVATGTFYCPTCRDDTVYSHQRVSKYFTLYFIPVFPMEQLGEYVRCGRCKGEFKAEVAGWGRERVEELLRPWGCALCNNANPAAEPNCLGCGAPYGTPPDAAAGAAAELIVPNAEPVFGSAFSSEAPRPVIDPVPAVVSGAWWSILAGPLKSCSHARWSR